MRLIATLIWLKTRLWWNGLRSRATAADNAVAIIISVLAAILSAGLAFGLSGITHLGFLDRTPDSIAAALTVVFWIVGFLAVVMPVFFGLGRSQIPLDRLLVFPLNRWQLYRISLSASFANGAHLFWYPVLAAVTVVAVVVDNAPATRWMAVVFTFAVCMVVWCHTVLTLVQRVLRRRQVREVAILAGLVLVVITSMVLVMYERHEDDPGPGWVGDVVPHTMTSTIGRLATAFPPSLAVRSLVSAETDASGEGALPLFLLVLWTGVGVAFGNVLIRRDLLEGGGSIRADSNRTVRTGASTRLLTMDRFTALPVGARGAAAKELRYLLRSTTGKFNILIMPIFVIIMSLLIARDLDHAVFGFERESLVFVGLMIYASMFSNNFLYNAYAWDGAGVQSYFLGPVPPRHVVLGKNVGVWLYNVVLGSEGTIAFCSMSGVPPATALIGGCLAFGAALLAATIVGNFLSPVMPVARDIASVTNTPSQTAVLATFGVLVANMLLIGGCLVVPALLGVKWLGPLFLAVLIAVEIGIYVTTLRSAGHLLETRRESLVEALRV